MNNDEIIIGGIYQHYKGGLYEVLNIATHTELNKRLVIYKNINCDKIWARPIEMFTSNIELNENELVERFKFLYKK